MMDVEKYLRRIEYDGPLQPTATLLRSLHRQHLFTVPFENLDIPLGAPINLDTDALFRKIVLSRRGGFCYELNGLFCQLLRALGFRVNMLSARVRREDGGFGPDCDHMLLHVELEEPWLVDVGFGDSFVNPLAFRAGAADRVNGYRYVVLPHGDDWQLVREDDKGSVPLYVFEARAREFDEYQPMCTFHQTSAESHFTKSWICSRATPEGRVTLANMRFIVSRTGQREEELLATEDDVRRCLRDAFGVELEKDAPLARLLRR